MSSELKRWEEDCRKYEVEYEEAKKKTKESLYPLKQELSNLEDQVRFLNFNFFFPILFL